jgi:hypothetical protein
VAQRSDRHPRQIEDDDVCGLTLLGFVVMADPAIALRASQLFGCTPLGPVAWAIAGSATAGATVITALLPVLPPAALPGLPSTDVHPEVAEPPAEHPLLAIAGS